MSIYANSSDVNPLLKGTATQTVYKRAMFVLVSPASNA